MFFGHEDPEANDNPKLKINLYKCNVTVIINIRIFIKLYEVSVPIHLMNCMLLFLNNNILYVQ